MNDTLIHSCQVLLLFGLVSVGIAGKKATCRQLLYALVLYSLNQNETGDTLQDSSLVHSTLNASTPAMQSTSSAPNRTLRILKGQKCRSP
jgi:hypothetical protein